MVGGEVKGASFTVQDLDTLIAQLECGAIIPANLAGWLVRALRAAKAKPRASLASLLGLSRRGISLQSAITRARRDKQVRYIAHTLPGRSATEQARALAMIIRGTAVAPSVEVGDKVERLRRDHAGNLPSSVRQLYSILKAKSRD